MPDVYPILKFPEVKGRNKYVKVRPWLRRPPPEVVIQSSGSHDPAVASHDLEGGVAQGEERGGVTREIHLDQVDDEFERLVKMRGRMGSEVGARLGGVKVGGVTRSKSMDK